MRGLVYKDFHLFFKSIDKKLILVAAAAVALLMVSAENFSGFLAAIMFAATIGIQNTMSFACDEQVNWKKYQLTMPVDAFHAVGGKYISVLLTIGLSIAAGIVLYLISGIIHRSFDTTLFLITMAAAVIFPLIWTALWLPFSYWFGFRTAQTMRLLIIIPLVFLIKFLEDGPGLDSMADAVSSHVLSSLVISAVVFAISYIVSVFGYMRKK